MIRAMTAAALALLAGCSGQEAANPADPSAYAVRLAVIPAAGGAVQRIDLPAEALAALRSPTAPTSACSTARARRSPWRSPARRQAAPRSMKCGSAPSRSSARPGRSPQRGGAPRRAARRRPRRHRGARARRAVETGHARRAVRHARDRSEGAQPAPRRGAAPQQPVRFTVETSADLADWTPAGGKILYRREGDRVGALGPEAIPLDDLDLKGRYLRVTWTSPQRLLAPVELRGATIGVARRLDADDRPAIATSPPRRIDAHDIRFTLPRPAILGAVAIAPAAGEMLVPVTLSGRNAPDQPWTPIGSGSLRAGSSAPVELSGGAFSDYRIEADRRTAGFAATPRLTLLFEPARLAVLFDGKPPYTLAAGAAGAESRYLAIGELVPGYRPGAEDALPRATVAAAAAPMLSLAQPDDSLFSPRKAVLWGLLLFGVAVLAAMVWRLWKPGPS
ncbi:DUF3999 family protein [Rhizorhabdus histidinilytica]